MLVQSYPCHRLGLNAIAGSKRLGSEKHQQSKTVTYDKRDGEKKQEQHRKREID